MFSILALAGVCSVSSPHSVASASGSASIATSGSPFASIASRPPCSRQVAARLAAVEPGGFTIPLSRFPAFSCAPTRGTGVRGSPTRRSVGSGRSRPMASRMAESKASLPLAGRDGAGASEAETGPLAGLLFGTNKSWEFICWRICWRRRNGGFRRIRRPAWFRRRRNGRRIRE